MSLKVFLDDDNEYFPGQTVSGRIECTFNSKKKLRAIRVKFWGRSRTEWTETETYHDSVAKEDKTKEVEYYAEEIHMHTKYTLLAGGENFSVDAGTYAYPFSHILPSQLPSSFEGAVGNVRYYIKAVVDRPWKFNYSKEVVLNIAPFIDLNLVPSLRDAVAISYDKTMFSCCCTTSPSVLTFNISMPISGYVPGQDINIGSYIQNLTKISAESVKFQLIAHNTYITRFPSKQAKYFSTKLALKVEGGIGAHGEKSWTSSLYIPLSGQYPNLTGSSIMEVHYNVKAEVALPFPHSNLKFKFPITIGTVAISGVNTSIPGPPSTPPINPDVPLPYLSEMRNDGSLLYVPLEEALSYPPGTSAPPEDVVPSYPPPVGWSVPYPLPNGDSVSNSFEKADWSEPNPTDTAASAPPPSYEESQSRDKK